MRWWGWCLILVLVGCLLCAVGGVVVVAAGIAVPAFLLNAEATEEVRQSFPTGSTATITLNNQVGRVDVRPSGGDQVVVVARKCARDFTQDRARDRLRSLTVNISGNGPNVTIEGRVPDRPGANIQADSIEFELQVPSQTSLNFTPNVGEVVASELTGGVQVTNNVGAIRLTNMRAVDRLNLRSDVGEIVYRGSLPESGTQRIQSNVGAITVELPPNSGFTLDARTDVGAISNSFPLRTTQTSQPNRLQGAAGDSPRVTLELQSNVGSITIRATG